MEALRMYLNSLLPAEQQDFASRCGTTLNYLRNAISSGKRLGDGLAVLIERESAGVVTAELVRPDIDWAVIRRAKSADATEVR